MRKESTLGPREPVDLLGETICHRREPVAARAVRLACSRNAITDDDDIRGRQRRGPSVGTVSGGWRSDTGRLVALAYVLGLSTAVAVIAHGVADLRAAEARRADALLVGTRHASEMADVVARQMEAVIQGIDLTLLQLREAHRHRRPDDFEAAVRVAIDALKDSGIQGVVVTDALGYVEYSSLSEEQQGVYLGDRGYIVAQASSAADRLAVGVPARSRLLASWSFVVSRKLRAVGPFEGAIVVGLAPQYFAERLIDPRLSSNDAVSVIHSDGSYLTRNQRLEQVLGTKVALEAPFLGPAAARQGVFRGTSPVDDRRRLFAWQRSEGADLTVTVGVDEETLLAPVEAAIRQDQLQDSLVAGLIVLLGGGLTALLLRTARQQARLEESEARYRRAFEENSSLKLLIDPRDGRLLDANDAAVQFYGYPRQVLLGKRMEELSDPSEAELASFLAEAEESGRRRFAFPQILAGGETRQVELYCGPIEVEGRRLLFAVLHDVTERAETMQKLKLGASMFAHTHEGIVYCDPEGQILDVNEAFVRGTGYSRGEAIGRHLRFVDAGHEGGVTAEAITRALRQEGHWRGEVWNRNKAGQVFAELLNLSAITDEAGRVTASVGIYSDITSLKESERHLEQLAQRDALTGLPNRVPLMDRLHQALRAAERQHEILAVVFLDLDGFKPVNDRFGHRRGDDVLIEVAQRLRRCVRAADTVCRVGGDEFVLLLRSLSSTDEAAAILERVRGELAQPYQVGETLINGVTASIGYACFPDDGGEPERLLSAADDAMYAGKRAGRDRVRRIGT